MYKFLLMHQGLLVISWHKLGISRGQPWCGLYPMGVNSDGRTMVKWWYLDEALSPLFQQLCHDFERTYGNIAFFYWTKLVNSLTAVVT